MTHLHENPGLISTVSYLPCLQTGAGTISSASSQSDISSSDHSSTTTAAVTKPTAVRRISGSPSVRERLAKYSASLDDPNIKPAAIRYVVIITFHLSG